MRLHLSDSDDSDELFLDDDDELGSRTTQSIEEDEGFWNSLKTGQGRFSFASKRGIIIGVAAVVVLVLVLIIVLSVSGSSDDHDDDHHDSSSTHHTTECGGVGGVGCVGSFEKVVIDSIDSLLNENQLKMASNHYTRNSHLAGSEQGHQLAEWTRDQFKSFGIEEVSLERFDVLLSYPISSSVSIVETQSGHTIWTAMNAEVKVDVDPTSDPQHGTPVFHGYAPTGTAQGQVVYVNYGRRQDYLTLVEQHNVSLEGRIALVRYGKGFRGNKCKLAQDYGAIGCLIYSDPADDGFARGETYPEGPWRPKFGVQRGSVWIGNGDPLTPGWPSTNGAPRLTIEQARDEELTNGQPLPSIPIHPLSWGDASEILSHITDGQIIDTWKGAVPNATYAYGPSSIEVNMDIRANFTMAPIYNVVGKIVGSVEPDRYVIIGNHRDAWGFGAMDPHSGSISLVGVAQALGDALKAGWRPRRSILLVSHDAEEYGLIGSMEWVEKHQVQLQAGGVAYLNADIAVEGRELFKASATPNLKVLIEQVANLTDAPSEAQVDTVLDMWPKEGPNHERYVEKLGSGSDYVGFLQEIGISSADLRFSGDSGYEGVYHSNYDSFYWITHFGDPTFEYHKTHAKIWAMTAMRLASHPVLPLHFIDYANDIQRYLEALKNFVLHQQQPSGPLRDSDFAPLMSATRQFKAAAQAVEKEHAHFMSMQDQVHDDPEMHANHLRALNDRLMLTERTFINEKALSGRGQYKHVIYAPGRFDSYSSDAFPALTDSIIDNDWPQARVQIQALSTIIEASAKFLKGTDL